jgi:hypothetical protein
MPSRGSALPIQLRTSIEVLKPLSIATACQFAQLLWRSCRNQMLGITASPDATAHLLNGAALQSRHANPRCPGRQVNDISIAVNFESGATIRVVDQHWSVTS